MRLLKQDINTFVGLGDPGYDKKENYILHERRLKKMIKYIDRQFPEFGPRSFLDVAGPSWIGEEIARHYKAEYYYTSGNIDKTNWSASAQKVHTVLMLEVIEHILNPLQFLINLRERIDFTSMVLTWPSRPSWLWTNIHYHELRLDRFEYLCELAGYEILDIQKGKVDEMWYKKFQSVRSFCRYWMNYHYMALIKPIK